MSASLLPALVSPSKQKPIRVLKTWHKRALALHLQGKALQEIARSVGRRPETVGAVLRNPSIKTLVMEANDYLDQEISALQFPAVDALRSGLKESHPNHYLKASEMVLKLNGRFDAAIENRDTAEDVVRRLIQVRSEGPVEVTIAEEKKSAS